MPYKSQAQHRLFRAKESKGELPQGTASTWAHHTPGGIKRLPQHVRKRKGRKAKKRVKAGAAVATPNLLDQYTTIFKQASLGASLRAPYGANVQDTGPDGVPSRASGPHYATLPAEKSATVARNPGLWEHAGAGKPAPAASNGGSGLSPAQARYLLSYAPASTYSGLGKAAQIFVPPSTQTPQPFSPTQAPVSAAPVTQNPEQLRQAMVQMMGGDKPVQPRGIQLGAQSVHGTADTLGSPIGAGKLGNGPGVGMSGAGTQLNIGAGGGKVASLLSGLKSLRPHPQVPSHMPYNEAAYSAAMDIDGNGGEMTPERAAALKKALGWRWYHQDPDELDAIETLMEQEAATESQHVGQWLGSPERMGVPASAYLNAQDGQPSAEEEAAWSAFNQRMQPQQKAAAGLADFGDALLGGNPTNQGKGIQPLYEYLANKWSGNGSVAPQPPPSLSPAAFAAYRQQHGPQAMMPGTSTSMSQAEYSNPFTPPWEPGDPSVTLKNIRAMNADFGVQPGLPSLPMHKENAASDPLSAELLAYAETPGMQNLLQALGCTIDKQGQIQTRRRKQPNYAERLEQMQARRDPAGISREPTDAMARAAKALGVSVNT